MRLGDVACFEVPMNDLVDIAVFAGTERSYFERHRISNGEQWIALIVYDSTRVKAPIPNF